MASPGADVRSIPALRDWLAAVANYRDASAEALSGVNQEIRRGFAWIEEQLTLWQRAVRTCEEEVTQAKAELAARKFEGFDGRMPDTTVQERNLRRAQARLEHAEEKVLACRRWIGKLPKAVEETFTGPGHRLATFLDGDLARGAALLDRRLDALERYAGLRTDYATGTSAAAAQPSASPAPRITPPGSPETPS